MAKKTTNKFSADQFGKPTKTEEKKAFYFGNKNFKLMLIGLGLILLGFVLMMGSDANTTPDGKFDPNYWNEAIFSFRRIRLAPILVIAGFIIQVVAILKRNKD
ncbi:Protein of unknown function [Epilithonimonas bovis DSM 19482]|uniref:DUF3098 domain-containing protein n=1 Tax=Epilithonimonas bovis DSM 19482 TaxID=1121284 RepID=A0A1U7PX90_9FLAO|nr:DUF3098 domain-containing protein [Epilithonimonas bovis]MDN5627388.1 DUF3098 domain-containing protein [Weeksellaceae bacterium]QIY82263.1 DUF3098 domain-containing protein [Chryseobacterium sp. NEB161]SIT97307.1 Protein of unknown function [Epilithonimonas bovis DSM 19482]HBR12520.1 DUF3098 domain-containing protein [Chryseobacterium sp.]